RPSVRPAPAMVPGAGVETSMTPAPLQAPALPGADLSLRSVANTVRVDIGRLDNLMNLVGELTIVRNTVTQLSEIVRQDPYLRSLTRDLHRVNRSFERHLAELQNGLLEVRMVPLGQV